MKASSYHAVRKLEYCECKMCIIDWCDLFLVKCTQLYRYVELQSWFFLHVVTGTAIILLSVTTLFGCLVLTYTVFTVYWISHNKRHYTARRYTCAKPRVWVVGYEYLSNSFYEEVVGSIHNTSQQIPFKQSAAYHRFVALWIMNPTGGISQTPATPLSDKFCIFCSLTSDALARLFQYPSPSEIPPPDDNISIGNSSPKVARSSDTSDQHPSVPDGCLGSASIDNYFISKSELQSKSQVDLILPIAKTPVSKYLGHTLGFRTTIYYHRITWTKVVTVCILIVQIAIWAGDIICWTQSALASHQYERLLLLFECIINPYTFHTSLNM